MNMLDSLRETGRTIGREIGRAWDNLSEGWHELLSRSGNALTPFTQSGKRKPKQEQALDGFPRWSLLAGELEETRSDVVVRVELPGLDKDDCAITVDGNMLVIRGEKRFERETSDSTYHVMERAYGSFQRAIALPRNVRADKASANFRNGVLTVRLPKGEQDDVRTIPVR
jgi:HSP20 family protein